MKQTNFQEKKRQRKGTKIFIDAKTHTSHTQKSHRNTSENKIDIQKKS